MFLTPCDARTTESSVGMGHRILLTMTDVSTIMRSTGETKAGLAGHVDPIRRMFNGIWQTLIERHELPIAIAGHTCIPRLVRTHPKPDALNTLLTACTLHAGYPANNSVSLTLTHELIGAT